MRFCAARALAAAGVDASWLRVEVPHPVLKGARIDLVVGIAQSIALMELKYPREPNPPNAAWTMTLGEVLKDLYRLAAYPGAVDRVFVYVETAHLRRYMTGVAARYGVNLDTDIVILRPAAITALPSTATAVIGPQLVAHQVTAQRLALLPIDESLRLAVYIRSTRSHHRATTMPSKSPPVRCPPARPGPVYVGRYSPRSTPS